MTLLLSLIVGVVSAAAGWFVAAAATIFIGGLSRRPNISEADA